MIFTSQELDRVLILHEKSYAMFRWLKDAASAGTVTFDSIHQSTDSTDAALEWLQRFRDSLPSSILDGLTDMRAFANLLISYLATSFELKATPKVAKARRQCCCGWCSWGTRLDYLVPRTPSRNDYHTAEDLKRVYLKQFVAELSVEIPAEQRKLFERNESLSFELAHLAYVRELVRRTEFASQGAGVLALWRTIAWKNSNPIPNFRLMPARILEAQFIVEAVVKHALVA